MRGGGGGEHVDEAGYTTVRSRVERGRQERRIGHKNRGVGNRDKHPVRIKTDALQSKDKRYTDTRWWRSVLPPNGASNTARENFIWSINKAEDLHSHRRSTHRGMAAYITSHHIASHIRSTAGTTMTWTGLHPRRKQQNQPNPTAQTSTIEKQAKQVK